MVDFRLDYFEGQLAQQILGDAIGVATWVDTRVFPDIAPEGTVLPYITFADITAQRAYHMTGDTGLTHNHVVQIDCWSDEPAESRQIAGKVIELLSAVQATWGTQIDVRRSHLASMAREYVPDGDGSEKGAWRTRMDWEFAYRDA